MRIQIFSKRNLYRARFLYSGNSKYIVTSVYEICKSKIFQVGLWFGLRSLWHPSRFANTRYMISISIGHQFLLILFKIIFQGYIDFEGNGSNQKITTNTKDIFFPFLFWILSEIDLERIGLYNMHIKSPRGYFEILFFKL